MASSGIELKAVWTTQALVLLATVLAMILLPGCAVSPSAKGPAPANSISVVTLNLYHDKADWPQRRTQIVDTLRTLQPDVIALQEVLGHETLPNQAQWLATQLGYQSYFSSVDPEDRVRRYGNAILTRHRILARDWLALRPLDDSRTAAHLRVEVDGRALNVYATHLHHTDAGGVMRVQQLDDLRAFIDRTAGGAPSIIAGDFNTTSDTPELRVLDARFQNSYDALHPDANADQVAHTTLNPHFFATGHRRIDHIYLQRDAFMPVDSRILFNQADGAGTWASDHFGLLTRFTISGAGAEPSP